MNPMPSKRVTGLLVLAAVMLVTRLFHFHYPPDASWAVFFLSGFYGYRLRAFALLLLEAVAIDYVTTAHLGMSSYCLSTAYALVLPAYAALWLGGRAAARHWQPRRWQRFAWLTAAVLLSVSVCFLLTNGGFYWLSGRHPNPDIAGWANGVAAWYPYFLAVPCTYIGLTLLVHQIAARMTGAGAATTPRAT
jgi:hypothetical protein